MLSCCCGDIYWPRVVQAPMCMYALAALVTHTQQIQILALASRDMPPNVELTVFLCVGVVLCMPHARGRRTALARRRSPLAHASHRP
jgi:hypothetical protein